jgi:hypothetical protein
MKTIKLEKPIKERTLPCVWHFEVQPSCNNPKVKSRKCLNMKTCKRYFEYS